MKRSTTALLILFKILIVTASFAQGSIPADKNETDTADVQHVIDAYHEAVHTHDAPRLSSLFLPQGSLWLSVLSDEAYAQAKTKSPGTQKTRLGSYADFAKLISNPKVSFNPTQTNVQMHSDGTIASVYFDFIFLIDGKEQNRGSETWTLIKGADGWRIAAVTYSSNPHTS